MHKPNLRPMSESKWAKLDEYLARVRSNEESSFVYSTSYNLSNEDVIRRLGAVVSANNELCGLRSLHLRATDLLVASLSQPDTYPLLEYLGSDQCGVTELKLDCNYILDEVQVLLPRIQSALLANRSVSQLELTLYQNNPIPVNIINSILDSLAVRPLGTLQELKLNLYSDDESAAEVLREVLLASLQFCPTNLSKLCLNGMRITMESCELLFSTLQACTSNRSRPESVQFMTCWFDREANEFLAKIMESEKIFKGDVDTGVVEISFDTRDCYCFEYSKPPCVLGCFRVPLHGRIRVTELAFASESGRDVPLAAYHLPMTLYMRKLEFLSIGMVGNEEQDEQDQLLEEACQSTLPAAFLHSNDTVQARQLLDGIRRNGSLHELVLDEERDRDRELLTPEMNRKVQAYLTRNREVPRLLSRPCIGGNGSEKDEAHDTTAAVLTKTDLTGFPPLMVAAMSASAMAPTNVLIGLAAVSMAEEFRLGGAKRKRPCSPS